MKKILPVITLLLVLLTFSFTCSANLAVQPIEISITMQDTFHSNLAVEDSQTFDLKIFMATTSGKLVPMSFNITFKSVAS